MDSDPILLFDGVCNLCSRTVQTVLSNNSKQHVKFASLQSEFGATALRKAGLPPEYMESLVLLESGNTYTRSDAALRLAKHMDGIWKLGFVFLIIPRFIRDPLYNWIAKNRYKWFGRKDVCWIPNETVKHRFLG